MVIAGLQAAHMQAKRVILKMLFLISGLKGKKSKNIEFDHPDKHNHVSDDYIQQYVQWYRLVQNDISVSA